MSKKKWWMKALAGVCAIFLSLGCTSCTAGADGKDGKSAYEIWLDNGHTGTEADFLEWRRGEDSSAQEGTPGLEYRLLSDGTGYFLVSQGSASEVDIVIASTYNGLPVVGIAESFTMQSFLIV